MFLLTQQLWFAKQTKFYHEVIYQIYFKYNYYIILFFVYILYNTYIHIIVAYLIFNISGATANLIGIFTTRSLLIIYHVKMFRKILEKGLKINKLCIFLELLLAQVSFVVFPESFSIIHCVVCFISTTRFSKHQDTILPDEFYVKRFMGCN